MTFEEKVNKERINRAKELFDSLKNFKELDSLFLPSVGKKLKEWMIYYEERMGMFGSSDMDVGAIGVIKDITAEIKNVIEHRALEGFRLLSTLIEERDIEIKELRLLLERDASEREFLNKLITQFDKIGINEEVVKKLEQLREYENGVTKEKDIIDSLKEEIAGLRKGGNDESNGSKVVEHRSY